MTSTSRVVRVAVLVLTSLLLLPAAASAASHAGHIDLQDGLTLAQQFGYTPDYRQHVVTFDAGNVPSIRSRGASEDDTSFVQRLEDGAWVRHDMLDALRAAYPDFAGTVHAGGYGTDRVDWDVEGRAYTVLTIRLDDDGGFRNVLMASVDGCQTWQVLELPFGNDTPQTDPHDWGNVTTEHDSGRLLEGAPLIAVWKQIGPWKGQWSSLNQLQVIKPYWNGNALLLRPPVTVSSLALTLLQCSGGASFAATRDGKSYFAYSTVVPRGTGSTPTFAATYDEVTNAVGASTLVARSLPANDLHCTPGIVMDSAGVLHVVTGAHGKPFKYAHSTSRCRRRAGPSRSTSSTAATGRRRRTPTAWAARPTSPWSSAQTTSCTSPVARYAATWTRTSAAMSTAHSCTNPWLRARRRGARRTSSWCPLWPSTRSTTRS